MSAARSIRMREAMAKTQKRKIVYICSPLRGDIENNVAKAEKFSISCFKQGNLPITPHAIFSRILNDNIFEERKAGMEMGMQLLSICDELWVFGKAITEGMQAEIEWAKQHGLKIRYCDSKVEEDDGDI